MRDDINIGLLKVYKVKENIKMAEVKEIMKK